MNPIRARLRQHGSIGFSQIEARVKDLNGVYLAARDRLEGRILSYVRDRRNSFTGPRLVMLMEELSKEFSGLELQYRDKVRHALGWVADGYYRDAMLSLGLTGNKSIAGGLSKERMRLALDDAYTHIAGATRNMNDYAVYQLRRLSSQVIREAAMTGETRREVSQRLLARNTEGGFFRFIDRSGKKWDNQTYFDMLGRTLLHNHGREAYLQGCADQGSDVVTVSTSGNPCPACAKYENRLLSISGKTPGLPTVEQAMAEGLFHPNCTHRLIAVPAAVAEKYYTADGRERTEETVKESKTLTAASSAEQPEPPLFEKKNTGNGTPAGKPVSEALAIKIKDPDLRANVEHALDVIAKVHGDGELPQIPLTSRKMKSEGVFRHLPKKPTDIAVHPNCDKPVLTTIHEIGHFLDFSALNESPGICGSFGNPIMDNWKKAVGESDAVQKLRLKTGNKALDQAHIKYLLLDDEIFARSYAQYIAQTSGDKTLMEELRRTLESDVGKVYNYQWNKKDFEPIAKVFDELFKLKGWIK